MAQYTYYTDPSTGLKVRDGIRERIENGIQTGIPEYVIDKELNEIGFSGNKSNDGGITGDWDNIGGAN